MQEICLTRTGWDEVLSEDLANKWRTLVEELRDSDDIRVSRHYMVRIQEEVKSYRLRGFGDASKGAYAGVVYLLVETHLGFFSRIVAAKTRVSPSQALTIPRLELVAALLLARLIHTIMESLKSEINILTPICYTDSKVALYCILGGEEIMEVVCT